MTFPTHFKFVFRGVFVNTPEEWSFSVKYRRDVEQGNDAELGDVNDGTVKDAIEALFGSGYFGTAVRHTEWRGYVIGTNGRMEGNPKIVVYPPGEEVNGNGSSNKPPQVCSVITTVGDDRGHARFGRFFLPTLAAPISSDLRMSTTDRDALGQAATDFLKGVSDAIDLPGTTNSAPAVNISGIGAGTIQDVDHLVVGRVLDTMRTRRNKLVEDYQSAGQIDW